MGKHKGRLANPKSDTEAQSSRSKDGSAFQLRMIEKLRKLCPPDFEVHTQEHIAIDDYNCRIDRTDLGIFASLDASIRHKNTQYLIVAIGCKTSFRERVKEDELGALLLKGKYPNVKWLELFSKEHESDSPEMIEKDTMKALLKSANFDHVLAPDTFFQHRETLEQWLKEVLGWARQHIAEFK